MCFSSFPNKFQQFRKQQEELETPVILGITSKPDFSPYFKFGFEIYEHVT